MKSLFHIKNVITAKQLTNLDMVGMLKRYIEFIILFVKLWGAPSWYKNVDNPNFWQWLYKWRTSIITACQVAYILHIKK